jgi:hypothetical protein
MEKSMYRAIGSSVLTLISIWAATAAADPPKLKGAYGFTGTAACLVAPGSSASATNPTPGTALPNSGFQADLRPVDSKAFSHSFAVEGIRTFNGDGTGTVKGTAVGITVPPTPAPPGYPAFPPAAGSNNFSFSFTYTVNDDGSWSSAMVPGSYSATIVSGPRTGQTETVDAIPPITGLISNDGKTLTAAHLTPTVEIHSFSNGDVWPEICHRSRVLIALSPSGKEKE